MLISITPKKQTMKKLFLLLTFAGFPLLAGNKPAYIETKHTIEQEAKKHIFLQSVYGREFSPELFFEALIYYEIHAPEIAFKQAVLETGNFQSKLFVEGNNLFGMRLPKSRNTTATGEMDHHASYSHWIDSIRDYKMFQDYYISVGYRLHNYIVFLHYIGYATDQNYINKLKSI